MSQQPNNSKEDTPQLDYLSWKFTLKFVFPIALVITLTLVFSSAMIIGYELTGSESPFPSSAPVEETEGREIEGGIINMMIFVVVALFGGFLMFFLIKYEFTRILELVFAVILGFSAFLFGMLVFLPVIVYSFYFLAIMFSFFIPEDIIYLFYNDLTNYFLIWTIPIIFGIFGFLTMGVHYFKIQKLHNAIMIIFGAAMGSFLGLTFPYLSLVLVLIGLSLYDIFAVLSPHGPLNRIFGSPTADNSSNEEFSTGEQKSEIASVIESKSISDNIENQQESSSVTVQVPSESLKPLQRTQEISLPMYTTGEVSIGLGDFVFYSMLISQALLLTFSEQQVWFVLFTLIGVVGGALLTFRLLAVKKFLPALPISIFSGLIGLTLVRLWFNLGLI